LEAGKEDIMRSMLKLVLVAVVLVSCAIFSFVEGKKENAQEK